jgi:hypothetical protein
MGQRHLVIETARDAVQWVFTRQIEPREAACSAGLVAEQMGWPPAAYCNPMVALAAHSAWQVSGDDFWRPFAMIPKATGWWYQPDSGAMVWIVDATQMAPLAGPCFESWWTDWCIAQPDTLMLRWLVREVTRRSRNTLVVDEETLQGTFRGKSVQAWAPRGGFRPLLPPHGQVNWLGLRDEHSVMMALMNFAEDGSVSCRLTSRDVDGAEVWPRAIHAFENGKWTSRDWDGRTAAMVPRDGIGVLEWGVSR